MKKGWIVFIAFLLILTFILLSKTQNSHDESSKRYFDVVMDSFSYGSQEQDLCTSELPMFFLESDNYNLFDPRYLREGQDKGEKVNSLYFSSTLKFSKNIVSDSGLVTGKLYVEYSPELRKIKTTGFENLDKKYVLDGLHIEEEIITYELEWEGFDENVKKVIGQDYLDIVVYSDPKYSLYPVEKRIFCENKLVEESGKFTCDIDEEYFKGFPGGSGPLFTSEGEMILEGGVAANLGKELLVDITPDIIRQDSYEVLDYGIIECDIS